MSRRPNDGYGYDAADTLHGDSKLVEPDVRRKLKDYFGAMGLGGKGAKEEAKITVTVGELRKLVREAIAEADKRTHGEPDLKCPKCGSRDVTTWAEDGESSEADWAECLKCDHYGKPEDFFELAEDPGTFGRQSMIINGDEDADDKMLVDEGDADDDEMIEGDPEAPFVAQGWYGGQGDPLYKLVSTGWPQRRGDVEDMLANALRLQRKSGDEEIDALVQMLEDALAGGGKKLRREFTDYAAEFQMDYDDRRYRQMAREIFNQWQERGPDVDWAGVVDLYARNRAKYLAAEIDKSKLYEKVLDVVENHYEGQFPPTGVVSHLRQGAG